MLVNIRKVRGEDAIRLHCNSSVKIMGRVGNLPGYGTVWYELTGIANFLLMLRTTNKFRVVFDRKGGNCFRMVLPERGVGFKLSPNGIYNFNVRDREIIVLLLNTVS